MFVFDAPHQAAYSRLPARMIPFGNRRDYSCSTPLVQYLESSSGEGTLSGRTTRKPRNCASVWYQMLLGSCGSCCFHDLAEALRAALRRSSGVSSQEPPGTACGYGVVALTH